jgi:hypothetical protein
LHAYDSQGCNVAYNFTVMEVSKPAIPNIQITILPAPTIGGWLNVSGTFGQEDDIEEVTVYVNFVKATCRVNGAHLLLCAVPAGTGARGTLQIVLACTKLTYMWSYPVHKFIYLIVYFTYVTIHLIYKYIVL